MPPLNYPEWRRLSSPVPWLIKYTAIYVPDYDFKQEGQF